MKTIRTVFAAVAIGASLSLAACSGGATPQPGSDQQQGQDQGADQGADQNTQQDAGYTKDQVEKALTDLGYKIEQTDASALNSFKDAKIEPAVCKEIIAQNLAKSGSKLQDSTVVGTKLAQNGSAAVSGVVFESADELNKALDAQAKDSNKCSKMTIEFSGQKIAMTSKSVDATVEGADRATIMRVKVEGTDRTVSSLNASKGNVQITSSYIPTGNSTAKPEKSEKILQDNAQEFLEKLG